MSAVIILESNSNDHFQSQQEQPADPEIEFVENEDRGEPWLQAFAGAAELAESENLWQPDFPTPAGVHPEGVLLWAVPGHCRDRAQTDVLLGQEVCGEGAQPS